MTLEEAERRSGGQNAPKPHNEMPPVGSLIRMTCSCRPYYRIGDMATCVRPRGWANFNHPDNAIICDGGIWAIMAGSFLVVREGPPEKAKARPFDLAKTKQRRKGSKHARER